MGTLQILENRKDITHTDTNFCDYLYFFGERGGGEHLVYFDTCFWSIYVKEEFPPATKLDIVPVHNSEQVALV